MAFTGGCLCGEIRYEINRTHLNAIHCYCGKCRRAHGTAFSTHAIMLPDQLLWIHGKATLRAYESSPGAYREFCPACGTHILVHGQTGDSTLAIPAGTLDGDPAITIIGHMFVEERVSWFEITDELVQYARWPPGVGEAR